MAMTTSPAQRSRHPSGRGGRDSADGQVLGALLVLAGIGWFVQQVGLVHLSLATMLSCLLITLGVGLVATARRTGGGGLVAIGVVLVVVLASTSAVDMGLLQRGVGERTFAPSAVDDLEQRYQLGVGALTLDLTDVPAADLAGRSIDVQLGVGELVVLLPPRGEVPVDVHAQARGGEIDVLGRGGDDGGTNLVERYRDDGIEGIAPLDLDLDVGLGAVQVLRPRGA